MKRIRANPRTGDPQAALDDEDEARSLRRCLRDLAALSALPSVWVEHDLPRSLQNLTDVLRAALRAFAVGLRVKLPDGAMLDATAAAGLGSERKRECEPGEWLDAMEVNPPDPASIVRFNGSGPLHAFRQAVFVDGRKIGFLAAVYEREFSLSENDRLLLHVASNQIALLLQRHQDHEERLARHRAEARLREAEHQYRQLVQSLPAAIYTCDNEGRITLYNEAAVALWGRRPVIGKDRWCGSWKIFRTDGSPMPLDECPMATAVREGRSVSGQEIIVERPDGTRSFVLPHPAPIRNEAQEIIGMVNMLVPVDELKRVEQELRASRTQLQSLLTLMPAAIYVCDADGRITFYNRRAAELWGREPSLHDDQEKFCATYRCWFNGLLAAPEDTPMAVAVREGRSFRNLEPEIERPDGLRLSVLVNIDPMLDAEGRPVGAINVFQDVTPLKRVEAALRASEERYRSLVSIITDVPWTADPGGAFAVPQPAWQAYTGQTWEEHSGFGWIEALHPDDREPVRADWKRACEARRLYQGEQRVWHAATRNYRCLSVRATPLLNADGGVREWVGTCTDIDDQRRAAEKLEQIVTERTASLKQAITQMEEFSYSVSHDLRAPVRAIEGYARILDQDYRSILPSEAQTYLDRIARCTVRMQRLIQDVLTLTRVAQQAIRLRGLALRPLVEEAIEQYAGTPEALIELGDLHSVIADEVSLSQAVTNLLSNAVKFVAPGVRPHVRVWSERRGRTVRIWVQDNGIGIRPEQQANLFGMFQRLRAHDGYDGTGIGLVIVRKAVQRMGGAVGVESDGVSGSRFWIELASGSRP